jgi:hypothetical protein
MKSLINKSMLLVLIAAALSSFATKPGGEGFQIYLDNNLLLERYGSEINTVKSFLLNPGTDNSKLSIKYHHCGKVGKNRIVTIKDEQNKQLKQFSYPDSKTAASVMIVDTKEIMSLKKGKANSLKLYYSSSELPNGRLLTLINL